MREKKKKPQGPLLFYHLLSGAQPSILIKKLLRLGVARSGVGGILGAVERRAFDEYS